MGGGRVDGGRVDGGRVGGEMGHVILMTLTFVHNKWANCTSNEAFISSCEV